MLYWIYYLSECLPVLLTPRCLLVPFPLSRCSSQQLFKDKSCELQKAGVGEQTQAICTFRRDGSRQDHLPEMLGASPCPGLQRTLNAHLLTAVTWSHQTASRGEDRGPSKATERQSSQSPDPPGGLGEGAVLGRECGCVGVGCLCVVGSCVTPCWQDLDG